MEELLNKLIEKGWKPRGKENAKIFYVKEDLRELVSKESLLRQFVCENGMVNINYGNIREYYSEQENGGIYLRRLNGEDNYEYRLIEASLKNEDELEQFLLDNIKVDVDIRG